MINNGFVRVASASPTIKVADVDFNTNEIIKLIDDAVNKNVSILVLPELCITGYTCADLFFQEPLIRKSIEKLILLKKYSTGKEILFVVGIPIKYKNALYNCAATISNGKILGVVPKTYIPNYNEFYEQRWFSSSETITNDKIIIDGEDVPFGSSILFKHTRYEDLCIGIDICEDLWSPLPPSTVHAINGATIILNPSASNDLVGKSSYRKALVSSQSAKTITSYVYSSAGFGESTTDVVFSGHCLIYENGTKLKENKRFQLESNLIYSDIDIEKLMADRIKMTSYSNHLTSRFDLQYQIVPFDLNIMQDKIDRYIDPQPFVPNNQKKRSKRCEEIFSIQTLGLAKRIKHIGCEKVVVGISGGLDSTLALLVCTMTYDLLGKDRKNIIGVTMPGFGTTDRTYNNAISLMNHLGVTIKEISIKQSCLVHFKDIGHDPTNHSTTYENVQARERTQILMDLSNKLNGIVIGTGDLSEMALGWATYNGDHMSMYSVNTTIPKTLVRYLVKWISDYKVGENAKAVLMDILDTPVSPELLPPDKNTGKIKQKTEEVVGPYELHDFFLYNMLRFGFSPTKVYRLALQAFDGKYSCDTIKKWINTFYKRFFMQQFKRSCIPDGPKVGSICLSPRGDLRMPSDAVSKIWLEEIEQL
ncbi:NAD(+) synthase [Vallitalea longa]|uniref:Glutamine-dependent NAD(+) synthetase n=1 Tax=Vallitalea longa TaxID=2936439 RepID=A0A9W5YED6_9FIRM|nr:NAD(+) synthase [Vallitalea longa]